MDAAPERRYRRPFGIFEAAILLVAAAGALWLLRPLGGARRAAAAEKEILAVLGALADAEDARSAPPRGLPVPLDALAGDPALAPRLQGFAPSKITGVLGNRSYWVTVLLPDAEGVLAFPRPGAAATSRGYAVVAWPKKGAAEVLRAVAALPGGAMWQRADGMPESGEPGAPPVPRTALGSAQVHVPDPPPDWVQAKKRR